MVQVSAQRNGFGHERDDSRYSCPTTAAGTNSIDFIANAITCVNASRINIGCGFDEWYNCVGHRSSVHSTNWNCEQDNNDDSSQANCRPQTKEQSSTLSL